MNIWIKGKNIWTCLIEIFRFGDLLGNFLEEAKGKLELLRVMEEKLIDLFNQLAEYLVFDKQKYHLEELMSDIKTFMESFKVIQK